MGALRDDLHRLIDATQDETLLQGVLMILSGRSDYVQGQLWSSLTPEQQDQVLQSDRELNDGESWISNEELKNKNQQWLK